MAGEGVPALNTKTAKEESQAIPVRGCAGRSQLKAAIVIGSIALLFVAMEVISDLPSKVEALPTHPPIAKDGTPIVVPIPLPLAVPSPTEPTAIVQIAKDGTPIVVPIPLPMAVPSPTPEEEQDIPEPTAIVQHHKPKHHSHLSWDAKARIVDKQLEALKKRQKYVKAMARRQHPSFWDKLLFSLR